MSNGNDKHMLTITFIFSAQQVLEKGCFLTPGYNDTCFDEDANIGVCWCHTDLCNSASRWSSSASLPWFLRILAWTSFTFFVFPGI